MNKIIFLSLFTLLFMTGSSVYSQKISEEKQVIALLKEFYTIYMTTVANDQPLQSEKKIDSLKKKYCTKRLLLRLPTLANQIDADPFLNAQDSSIDCLKTLSVRKNPKAFNQFIVTYFDIYSQSKFIIYLTIVKENGNFKIDSIHW